MSKKSKGLQLVKPYYYGLIPIVPGAEDDIDYEGMGIQRPDDTDVEFRLEYALTYIANCTLTPALDTDGKVCTKVTSEDGFYRIIYATLDEIINECFSN